jgi:hypothetical protein
LAVGEEVLDLLVMAAISLFCHEFSHVVALGSCVFQSVPWNLLQYTVEGKDSFHKHVYKPAIEGKIGGGGAMSKSEACKVLDLFDHDDKSAIK